ncbi:twin arginine translocase protein A [Poriferisphaera corsica]|uniref:Sec-independent protein translocase protein TatA n=1 Tax=Poriferisphaera corsica TaxID=2528020 RepID=A0A517YRL2_9BACT|nr:twin-arginine translocase TatA/TatE family subunit [Poriferisphaera corsica]QDU32868.1 twin arginine translocase protein A [Poriferisphaera corsica]
MEWNTVVTMGFFGQIGWQEILILALIGVLLFGRRLPEIGKKMGQGIVEFKKGLAGIEDDIDPASQSQPRIDNQQSGQQMDMTGNEKEKSPTDNPQNGQSA